MPTQDINTLITNNINNDTLLGQLFPLAMGFVEDPTVDPRNFSYVADAMFHKLGFSEKYRHIMSGELMDNPQVLQISATSFTPQQFRNDLITTASTAITYDPTVKSLITLNKYRCTTSYQPFTREYWDYYRQLSNVSKSIDFIMQFISVLEQSYINHSASNMVYMDDVLLQILNGNTTFQVNTMNGSGTSDISNAIYGLPANIGTSQKNITFTTFVNARNDMVAAKLIQQNTKALFFVTYDVGIQLQNLYNNGASTAAIQSSAASLRPTLATDVYYSPQHAEPYASYVLDMGRVTIVPLPLTQSYRLMKQTGPNASLNTLMVTEHAMADIKPLTPVLAQQAYSSGFYGIQAAPGNPFRTFKMMPHNVFAQMDLIPAQATSRYLDYMQIITASAFVPVPLKFELAGLIPLTPTDYAGNTIFSQAQLNAQYTNYQNSYNYEIGNVLSNVQTRIQEIESKMIGGGGNIISNNNYVKMDSSVQMTL
jgi:hypothetical protein